MGSRINYNKKMKCYNEEGGSPKQELRIEKTVQPEEMEDIQETQQ